MGCLHSKERSNYTETATQFDVDLQGEHTDNASGEDELQQGVGPQSEKGKVIISQQQQACGVRQVNFGVTQEIALPPTEDNGMEEPQHSFVVLQRNLSKTAVASVPFQSKAAGLKHIGYGGMKKENQDDFHVQVGHVSSRPNSGLYCIFDGHGTYGGRVVKYCVKVLPALLQEELRLYYEKVRQPDPGNKEAIDMIITDVFKETERGLQKSGVNISASGTTASVLYQEGNKIWCAAVGDSRVIMCSKSEGRLVAQPLTIDHRPARRTERARVEACGGRIEPKRLTSGRAVGEPRLWLQDIPTPGLLLSRSIGDNVASSIGCTAEPEITFATVRPFIDTHLVMASDGVWDVLSNEQVCDIIAIYQEPQVACEQICQAALAEWEERLAADNISVLVVQLLWGSEEQWGSACEPMIQMADASIATTIDSQYMMT